MYQAVSMAAWGQKNDRKKYVNAMEKHIKGNSGKNSKNGMTVGDLIKVASR